MDIMHRTQHDRTDKPKHLSLISLHFGFRLKFREACCFPTKAIWIVYPYAFNLDNRLARQQIAMQLAKTVSITYDQCNNKDNCLTSINLFLRAVEKKKI